ncbi:MAG: hypothetical protein LIO96_12975 [Lachnospiraceae bacterium]|nr:hypothetical protein [Lachnospiraceae bacterium]
MSPQDKVERVLKEMHVAFSQSPTYNGQPDKIIMNRRDFLLLLDRLNRGIYDMMEQYEQTRQSRANAERSFRRKGNEIIEKANASADDIYAASVIYTADAIGRIRDLMDQTNDSMNDLFRQFRRELREQKDTLRSHESELQAQLADLADTKKYLDLLQDVNRERERNQRRAETEQDSDDRYAYTSYRAAAPAAQVQVNEEYFEKPDAVRPERAEMPVHTVAEAPDIRVNENAAYFKWKEAQDRNKLAETSSAADSDDSNTGEATAEEAVNGLKQGVCAPEEPETVSEAEPSVFFREEPGGEIGQEKSIAAPGDSGEQEDPDFVLPEEEELLNSAFPDEEAIRQAVLEDERKAEVKQRETAGREKPRAGGILKTIIFGKDQ